MPGLSNTSDVEGVERNLTARVTAAVPTAGQVFWRVDSSIMSPTDVRVERNGCDLVLINRSKNLLLQPVKRSIWRSAAVLSYFEAAGSDVSEMTFNLADGHMPSQALCSFSSFDSRMHLVPDFYFFRETGYHALRQQFSENSVPWPERSTELVWRGKPSGVGVFSCSPSQKDNALVRQRLRMALHARDTKLDFRFASTKSPLEAKLLSAEGLMADRVELETWANRKFAVDIDGFSNAWDNFFHRLLLGNCILKVDSQMGFRQWYYDKLKPYQHYVPVKKDLSNLREQIDWALSHDAEAEAIAAAGQKVAQSLTWDKVLVDTAAGLQRLVGASA